jgi:squalene cyclase
MGKWVLAAAGLFFGLAVAPAWAEGEGSYALFEGTYNRYDGAQGVYVETRDVFLLNTVTGDASVLVSSLDEKGRRVRYWEPVVLDEAQQGGAFGIRESRQL